MGSLLDRLSEALAPRYPPPSPTYARRLALFDGPMLVLGGVLAAGIVLHPALVP